ncbi:VOC family protein [Jiangella anatolica]|uniref:VOC domain-containing protein n=1 Tax=Jiangella anatolica TaxID=2670374 RepID=A0A2W2AZI2_9ACTN|nr:VOC family protein [Jiangella anatolica]PZF79152.1 hypothetical protein C1I92_32620 [Jiangella anatolica]
MTTSTFINLPVDDLAAARAFYAALGWSFDENFSDEKALTVRVSDTIYVMLLRRPYFQTYLTTEVADARKVNEAMLGLSAESRVAVDELVERAQSAGGGFARDPQDLGYMYSRSFRDPDGHFWEIFWIDPQAAAGGPPAS